MWLRRSVLVRLGGLCAEPCEPCMCPSRVHTCVAPLVMYVFVAPLPPLCHFRLFISFRRSNELASDKTESLLRL